MQNIILFATEIVKSLPNWYNKGLISVNFCKKYSKTLIELVSLSDNPACINFYFEILSTLINHTLS
jgi:hypothetical protein